MPPNPDMATVMSQMAQMQAAQASSANMLAASIGSIQQTITQMAEATQLGVQTAYSGGASAFSALQLGAAAAFGDVAAIGGAIGGGLSILSGPPGPAPAPSMGGLGGAGGMTVGAGNIAYGASVGALSLAGVAGGYAAWVGTSAALGAGFRAATGAGRGFGAAVGMGARIGARTLGGGLVRGAIGGALGAGAVAGAALIIPLAASLAIEQAVATGIEHMGAVRDVSAVLAQQSGRISGFDPNVITPAAGQFRGLSAQIVGDVARAGGVSVGQAAQFISQAGEMGLFAGAAESPGGVRGRARELSQAIKEMTSLLGTSMEEGIAMLGELRQAGITGGDAPGAILAERGRARLGGFTGAEMHAVGMRGAQMFRGTGFGPAIGFNAAQSNLAQVSDLVQRGVIDNSLVAAMGGRQAMGEAMTQSQLQFMQGGAGRAFLAAGPQGGMDVLSGRLNFAQGAIQGLDTSDPTRLAIFLGSQGQRAQEMGPEMIAAGQQRALLEFARRAGVILEGLTREQQVQALAGVAATPAGQRVLGVRGLDQATLLATQTLAGPETLTRQAQAMRIETQREALLRYNEQNVGFSGAWFKTTTFFNELGEGIGAPFRATYNAAATAWDDFGEDTSKWWDGTKTEILTKANVTAISKAAKAVARDPRSGRGVRAILNPKDIERIRANADVVTLSGTMRELNNQIRARGLTVVGDAEETFLSQVGGIGRPIIGEVTTAAFREEMEDSRMFTIDAIRSAEVQAFNVGANEVARARLERAGRSVEGRKADARAVDLMLFDPKKISEEEERLIEANRTYAKPEIGKIFNLVLHREAMHAKAVRGGTIRIAADARDEKIPLKQRMDSVRRWADMVSGGDKKKSLLVQTDAGLWGEDVVAGLSRGVDETTLSDGLKEDSTKLDEQYKESAESISETLLQGTSNVQIKFIQTQMDIIAKMTDSRSSPRVVIEAADQLSKNAAKSGISLSQQQAIKRALEVTPEQKEELQRVGGRAGLFTLRRRAERAVGREAEELFERALARPEGREVTKAETEALDFVRRFAQKPFTDMNQMVDDLTDTQRQNVLKQLDRSPATKAIFEALTQGDLTDEKSIRKVMRSGLEGVEDVKIAPGEQARVEAFQSETLVGMKGVTQSIEHLVLITAAMRAELKSSGIGVSK